ncbi:MAG: long-chain fatty acid--CoA ligase [Rhodospirillales bacterium]|nr:long-chain fatty acid--CoA ligase [Rhodospirillales bacterium]
MTGTDHPFTSAFAAFEATAKAHPDNAFLAVPARADRDYYPAGVEFTYRAALDHILELRSLYERSGIGHGHRVALLLGNQPEHFFHLFALNALGASVVPLNPDNRPEEMLYAITHSESDLAFAANARLAELTGIAARRETPLPVYSVQNLPDRLATPVKPMRTDAPGLSAEAALLYTSGTTGSPKGCMISNDYFLTSGSWYVTRGGRLSFTFGQERLFNPFPVFHMNAGVMSLMAVTLTASCLISADRFHPKSWWRDLVDTGATAVHYMGVIPPILFKQEAMPEERLHKVKFGLGASVDPTLHTAFEERFGFAMVEVWGMTETGRVFCDNIEPRQVTTRAIGAPRDGLEVKIADDNDNAVPQGRDGQLLVRFAGPDPRKGFFSGYLKETEATEEAWRGGWFHTGDVVRQGTDGMLYFVDRRKNIVRRSGENISAAEVEESIITHPSVNTCAVLPIEDELREEEVMACVVLSEGVTPDRETATAIFSHCRDQLAYYKTPGWIVFRDKLPTTTTTKIQKGLIFAAHEDPRTIPGSHDFRGEKRRHPAAA